jgi:hypothetical protein
VLYFPKQNKIFNEHLNSHQLTILSPHDDPSKPLPSQLALLSRDDVTFVDDILMKMKDNRGK